MYYSVYKPFSLFLINLCSDAIISCGVIMMNEKFDFFEELGMQKGAP